MVERRLQLATGLHKRQYIMLALPGEPQLTASPRAHAVSRDSHLAAHGCRDVTDRCLGGLRGAPGCALDVETWAFECLYT